MDFSYLRFRAKLVNCWKNKTKNEKWETKETTNWVLSISVQLELECYYQMLQLNVIINPSLINKWNKMQVFMFSDHV